LVHGKPEPWSPLLEPLGARGRSVPVSWLLSLCYNGWEPRPSAARAVYVAAKCLKCEVVILIFLQRFVQDKMRI
jgi:hypothetical protein